VLDLTALLKSCADSVRTEISTKPEVVPAPKDADPWNAPIEVRRWWSFADVACTFVDLRNSTRLGLNKHTASTASIYEAAVRNAAEIFTSMGADSVAIQGDGAFAVFWGERRYERALCSGITVKTFSEKELVPQLKAKWQSLPETGFKVGIASSKVLMKRVGLPRTAIQEPVWAGKAVNYAAKAGQAASPSKLIVAGSVWDYFAKNDYVTHSCDCGGSPKELWSATRIEHLTGDDGEEEGKALGSNWCSECGAEFCAAILAGETKRNGVRWSRFATWPSLARRCDRRQQTYGS
jgi:class 3 adenylate cyclase